MTKKILILFAVICISFCMLEEQDKFCLINSLAVGGTNDKIMDWTCKYCNSSYEPTPLDNTPKNIRIVEGYNNAWLQNKFTQDFKAIITLYDNFIILAFKFTDNIPKLFVDLKFNPKNLNEEDVYYNDCKHCRAHQGFLKLWEHNRENVFKSLREIYKIGKVPKLYITGISLGGALAVMSFVDIKKNFTQFTDIQVTTFGAPRVGNKQFAIYFDKFTNQSSRRFVVKKDPIPNLPPKALGNYQHVGVQQLCDIKNKICVDKGHVNTDFLNQGLDDQNFLKTLLQPSMFDISLCKSEKNSHNFLRKRVFQHQLQNYDRENLYTHQFSKHNSVINHICDYPKLINFPLEVENDEGFDISNKINNVALNNKIIFGTQYRLMLVHSLGVFSNQTQIQNWNFPFHNMSDQPSNKNNISIFQTKEGKKGLKAMITTFLNKGDNKFMVLTFRGSATNDNWFSNIDKKIVKYENCNPKQCKVHQGFYQLWKTNRDQIIQSLIKIQKENNLSKLYITGISLGGALAQVSVLDILNKMKSLNISVVTFGSPRVGNNVWGEQYQKALRNMPMTQRFTLQKDPVPIVPAWPLQPIPKNKYFQIGVQDKCYIEQKQCLSQKQGDNNKTLNGLQLFQLGQQVNHIISTIKNQCDHRPEIYCGFQPKGSKYQNCTLQKSGVPDWDFNVHVCNYPKLFQLPLS